MDRSAFLMKISMKKSIIMIEPMALACIPMQVRAFTEGPLKITSKGQRGGLTGLIPQEITRKARSMDGGHSSELMGQ